MANRFARGFEQTFGTSFQQGLVTAEAGRKERRKLKEEFERGEKIAKILEDVPGIEQEVELLRTGEFDLNSFVKTISARRDALEAAAKAPTIEERTRFGGRGIAPDITQRPLEARGLVSTTPAGEVSQALQPRVAQAVDQAGFRVTKEVQKSPSGLTTRTVEPIETEEQLDKELLNLADEKFISSIATKSIGRLFKSQEQKTNFTKVVGLMSRLISQVKGVKEEQGGLGLLPGTIGAVNVFFKNDEFGRTSALPGQITEATFALNSILTGQNRVIRGITEKIAGTLLGRFDPSTFIASKTTQTIRNSYLLSKAIEKTGITPKQLDGLKGRKIKFGGRDVEEIDLSEIGIDIEQVIASITLSKEEERELDAIIKVVLGAPATEREDLPEEEPDKLEKTLIQTTPTGVEFQILN